MAADLAFLTNTAFYPRSLVLMTVTIGGYTKKRPLCFTASSAIMASWMRTSARLCTWSSYWCNAAAMNSSKLTKKSSKQFSLLPGAKWDTKN